MRAMLRFFAIVAAVLLLAPSSAHAVKNCPTLQEILDQYVRAESPRGIKEWATRMVQLMKSRAKWDGFLNFSAKEFSSENIHLLVAIRTYEQEFDVLNPSERLTLANLIYDTFIAKHDVNLDSTTFDTLGAWRIQKVQSVTKSVFQRAHLDVLNNCNDTYARFKAEVKTNGLGKDKSYINCK